MSLTLLLSDRLRAVLTWAAHHPRVPEAAAALVVLVAVAHREMAGPCIPVLLAMFLATRVADRLHTELDDAGIPCRWCDLTAEADES